MGKTKMKRTEAGSGNLKEHFKRNWPYYVMMLPGIIYLVMFKYIPMLGSVIAFKDYSAYKGIWVGYQTHQTLNRLRSSTLGIGFQIFPQ